MEEIQKSIDQIKEIQKNLLSYIEDEAGGESNFETFKEILENSKFCENKYKFQHLLYSISKILINHRHEPHYYDKIEQILNLLKDGIKKNFRNYDIFDIFESDKLILLCLKNNRIFRFDSNISDIFTDHSLYKSKDYDEYFVPEIKNIKSKPFIPNLLYNSKVKKLPEDFDEKRKIGENDDLICQIIRKDSIDDFISYIEKNNIPLESNIKSSIYESNNYLIHRYCDLIRYSAFYGSIQIFNYLKLKGVNLEPDLWNFAIYSHNPEIIHILEENNVQPNKSYKVLLEKAIECFSNDIAYYILNTHLADSDVNKIAIGPAILSDNYEFIKVEEIDGNLIPQLFNSNHYQIIEYLFKENKVNGDFSKELYESVRSNNIDYVKLFLTSDQINVNIRYKI